MATPSKGKKKVRRERKSRTAERKPERPGDGRFSPGNRAWEARQSSGPAPKFADAESLWKACVQYFEWVEANPLYEDQIISYQGAATHEPVAKMRAMTKRALCRYLGIERTTWNNWKSDRPDLAPTIELVESVIWDQKFTGAAAGLLNANIIARELGLADKQEHTGEGGGPIKTEDLTPRRPSEDRMNEILARYGGGSDARNAARDAEQARRERLNAEASAKHEAGRAKGETRLQDWLGEPGRTAKDAT